MDGLRVGVAGPDLVLFFLVTMIDLDEEAGSRDKLVEASNVKSRRSPVRSFLGLLLRGNAKTSAKMTPPVALRVDEEDGRAFRICEREISVSELSSVSYEDSSSKYDSSRHVSSR